MSKQFIKDCFSFTKKERTGITALLILILFFVALPILYPLIIKPESVTYESYQDEIAAIKLKQQDSLFSYAKADYAGEEGYKKNYPENVYNVRNKSMPQLFYFDPNTAGENDWKRLGLRDKTIQTILHFIEKGGRFQKPDDIRKIWGLHQDEIARLMPYIKIKEKSVAGNYTETAYEKVPFKSFVKTNTPIDINIADTGALIALPGIGTKLSQRIISYRDKLGGFYSVNQLSETFGLPDSTFQKIKQRFVLQSIQLKKININTATAEEMKHHPYLRYQLANAILQYRNQHGNYKAVTDIKKLMVITDEVFEKIAPYLTVNSDF